MKVPESLSIPGTFCLLDRVRYQAVQGIVWLNIAKLPGSGQRVSNRIDDGGMRHHGMNIHGEVI